MNKIDQERRALFKSFLYAFRGVRFCVKNERNMRIHLAAAVFVTVFSLVYGLTPGEYAVLFLTMGAVVAAEAVNTAVEAGGEPGKPLPITSWPASPRMWRPEAVLP